MSPSDLGNVRLGTGRGRGMGRWDYCSLPGPRKRERRRGSSQDATNKARLINRVLSSSNWQSSNNHLEAPPVNPELILGVTVPPLLPPRKVSSQLSSPRGERVSHSSAAFPAFLPRPPPSPPRPSLANLQLKYLIPRSRLHLIWIFSIAR